MNSLAEELAELSSRKKEEVKPEEVKDGLQEEPKEEPKEKVEPKKEEPKEEGKGEEVKEGQEEGEPEGEEEDWRKKLDEMAKNHMEGGGEEPNPEEVQKEEEKGEPDGDDWLNGLGIEIGEDEDIEPEAINVSLRNVAKEVLKRAESQASASVIKKLTPAISKYIGDVVNTNMAFVEFYQKNEDLKQYSNYVNFKMSKLRSENPNIKLQELLNKTEEEVRKDLKSRREEGKKDAKQKINPAFPKGTSAQRVSDTRDALQKELDELQP